MAAGGIHQGGDEDGCGDWREQCYADLVGCDPTGAGKPERAEFRMRQVEG
jgi:hypothetical protein